jgi:hypothetical protein
MYFLVFRKTTNVHDSINPRLVHCSSSRTFHSVHIRRPTTGFQRQTHPSSHYTYHDDRQMRSLVRDCCIVSDTVRTWMWTLEFGPERKCLYHVLRTRFLNSFRIKVLFVFRCRPRMSGRLPSGPRCYTRKYMFEQVKTDKTTCTCGPVC